MAARSKVFVSILLLGLVDAVVPGLPIIGLILLYVLFYRPAWFADLVRDLYRQ